MRKFEISIIIIFLSIWTWSAINPIDRLIWILENIAVFALIISLIVLKIKFNFVPSKLSYLLMTLFIIIHMIGAHYTYSYLSIPFQGFFERNMYDRLAHFLFGLLFTLPLKELFSRFTKIKNNMIYFIVFLAIVASSGFYETAEWVAAEIFAEENIEKFLGMQTDIWDAQKDMLMAYLGSLIAIIASIILHSKIQKNKQ